MTHIALSDGGVPDISLSVEQVTTDADVLGRISRAFKYAITDGPTNIVADLGDGDASKILTLGAKVDTITISGADRMLTLSAGTLLSERRGRQRRLGHRQGLQSHRPDDGGRDDPRPGRRPFAACSADRYHGRRQQRQHPGDLNDNVGSSALLANVTSIIGIATSGAITLDYATATAFGVNDGFGSVFSEMTGETLAVTGVPVHRHRVSV